jgi:hypothetical protein
MCVKLRHHGRKSSTVASVLTAFRFVEGATESVTEAVEIYIYIVKLSFATLEQCTRCNFSETGPWGDLGELKRLYAEWKQLQRTKPNSPCPCGSGKKYKECCKQRVGSQ